MAVGNFTPFAHLFSICCTNFVLVLSIESNKPQEGFSTNFPHETSGYNKTTVVSWVPISSDSEVIQLCPEAAGHSGNVHVYTCRGYANPDWLKSGFLWVDKGSIWCAIGHQGKELKLSSYQMLSARPGSTSWVPLGSGLPKNAISNTAPDNYLENYVCRGWVEQSLLVGHYIAHAKICYISKGTSERPIKENVEILVENF